MGGRFNGGRAAAKLNKILKKGGKGGSLSPSDGPREDGKKIGGFSGILVGNGEDQCPPHDFTTGR